MLILKNSKELLEHLQSSNFNHITSIKSFDFSNIYTTISHQKLKSRLATIIRNSFIYKIWNRRYKFLVVGRERPYFIKEHPDFENYLGQVYPPELEIKHTTESNTSASYLDLLLSIGRDGQLRTSLYDKRDDFNFHITNFPFLSSKIPSSPDYGVFISQLIRYARACSSYECFILRAMRLSNQLLGQGYVKERLKSSLRKFYGRYGDLTKQYEVPLSRMLHDILDDDYIQWHPPLIGHYTNFLPLLVLALLPNLTFYLIVQDFHRAYATGGACQQRTLTPPDTWSCTTLGLACVLMSRSISPELVLSPDFWISNIPLYFSFAQVRKTSTLKMTPVTCLSF